MILETVLKILGIVVTAISTIVKVADMLNKAKNKHQKSNRTDQS